MSAIFLNLHADGVAKTVLINYIIIITKLNVLFSEKNTLDVFVNGDKVETFVSIIIQGGGLGGGGSPINWFNPVMFLCLSEARIWISIFLCCVFSQFSFC